MEQLPAAPEPREAVTCCKEHSAQRDQAVTPAKARGAGCVLTNELSPLTTWNSFINRRLSGLPGTAASLVPVRDFCPPGHSPPFQSHTHGRCAACSTKQLHLPGRFCQKVAQQSAQPAQGFFQAALSCYAQLLTQTMHAAADWRSMQRLRARRTCAARWRRWRATRSCCRRLLLAARGPCRSPSTSACWPVHSLEIGLLAAGVM